MIGVKDAGQKPGGFLKSAGCSSKYLQNASGLWQRT
jgi:hypothetical protein